MSARILQLLWAIPWCAASCGRPAAAPEGLAVVQETPFDDLLRFVPAGLESLLCFDLRRTDAPPALVQAMRNGMFLPLVGEHPADTEHLLRGVWCAGKFCPRSQCAGDYEGVFVFEYVIR